MMDPIVIKDNGKVLAVFDSEGLASTWAYGKFSPEYVSQLDFSMEPAPWFIPRGCDFRKHDEDEWADEYSDQPDTDAFGQVFSDADSGL